MQFTIVSILALAASAAAMPKPQADGGPYGDVTVAQAGDTCGQDLELSCCNSVDQSGDSTNVADGILSGLLSGALEGGDLGLFSGCSKLNVAALIGVSDLLNDQCTQNVACCQHSGTQQDGLVNVGLPCVALDGLL
ncbi:hypothetical protein F4778DRAFT_791413 [Xylariomycetidae sp. FL2044]|nr:hypothetical protein F4778DRAFT_791413 [Xylariomycetidae sp. FL2044]